MAFSLPKNQEIEPCGPRFGVKSATNRATSVSWRAPYMTSAPMRKLANSGHLDFVDMHLSHVSQMVVEGFLGRLDVAIVEATDITHDGRVYLTTGIGNSPTFLQKAERVIIEL